MRFEVAIIGQGYVGLTIAAFAAEFFHVVGFDSNQKIAPANGYR